MSRTIKGNRKDAYGLERAKNAHIPTTYHNIVRFRKMHPEDQNAAKLEFDSEYVLFLDFRLRSAIGRLVKDGISDLIISASIFSKY